MRVTPRESPDLRCAVCHGELAKGGLVCDACGSELHEDCFHELGKCPTLGCERVVNKRRPSEHWLMVAVLFNALCVSISACVLLAACVEQPVVMRSEEPASAAVPAFVSPVSTPRQPALRVPGLASTEALRRECITLIENASPLERDFDARESTLLPEPISALEPRRVTINAHTVSIKLAGITVYVFDRSTHEPPLAQGDSRWMYLADGVWALRE